MFELSEHGPDTYVGRGPHYPWGGLYGGQIVAQSLVAAANTVEERFAPHSLRAYFIRRGTGGEPIRFEVDRTRNGRSFVTRRVIARQAVGAILNLEASFQHREESFDIQTAVKPDVAGPDDLSGERWSDVFERRDVPAADATALGGEGLGVVMVWMRGTAPVGSLDDPRAAIEHQAWFAYMSDDLPFESARAAVSHHIGGNVHERLTGASLDHTIWYHAPFRADEWLLHVVRCERYVGSRALTTAHVFQPDGRHVATYAQELLQRVDRNAPSA